MIVNRDTVEFHVINFIASRSCQLGIHAQSPGVVALVEDLVNYIMSIQEESNDRVPKMVNKDFGR